MTFVSHESHLSCFPNQERNRPLPSVCDSPALDQTCVYRHDKPSKKRRRKEEEQATQSIEILTVLLLSSGSRNLNLLALLGLQRKDDDKQRFVRGAVLEDVSERVRTVRQQERGYVLACLVLARNGNAFFFFRTGKKS